MNTLVKWIGGTALAASAAAALLVPSRTDADALRALRADTLNLNYNKARASLLVFRRVVARGEARETARSVSGVHTEVPLVRVASGIAKPVADAINEQVQRELRAAKAIPSKYPIAVVVQIDSSLPLGAMHTLSVALPESVGDACTTVLRLANNRAQNWQMVSTQRLLSTCAFYAAFGQPGAGTQAYLDETRGISARWIKVPPAFEEMDDFQTSYRIPYNGWSEVVESTLRCRLGNLEGCERVVGAESINRGYYEDIDLDSIDRTPLRTEFPGVDVVSSAGWWNEHKIRAGAMAVLAQELGPERFGAIWRDPRGFRAAYETNSGRPFTEWVRDYVAVRVAEHPKGPAIPMLAIAVAFAILLSAFSLAIARAPRQMS